MELINHFQSFSYIFDGLIFKILPDEVLPLLALEIRHTESKEVSFAVIDYEKSQMVFEGLGLEEKWWIGMAGFYNGKLFFHSFADKQYPQTQGIIVADIFEQALIWEKEGAYLEEVNQNGVHISWINSLERENGILDIHTGNPIEQITYLENDKKKHILFPFQYAEKTPYFETLALFLSQKLTIDIVEQLDYLEFKNYIVISYLIKINIKLSRFLLILSQDGEILLHQIIDNELQGKQTEVFFIVNDFLIAIANRKKLLIFKL